MGMVHFRCEKHMKNPTPCYVREQEPFAHQLVTQKWKRSATEPCGPVRELVRESDLEPLDTC